jgi:hypothetical protein
MNRAYTNMETPHKSRYINEVRSVRLFYEEMIRKNIWNKEEHTIKFHTNTIRLIQVG